MNINMKELVKQLIQHVQKWVKNNFFVQLVMKNTIVIVTLLLQKKFLVNLTLSTIKYLIKNSMLVSILPKKILIMSLTQLAN